MPLRILESVQQKTRLTTVADSNLHLLTNMTGHISFLTKYLQVYLAGIPLPTSIHGEPNRVPLHKTYTERPSTTQWAGLAVCQEWTRSTVSAHWDIEWQQPGPTDSQLHFGNSLPHFGNVLPPFHQYVCLWMFGLNVDLVWMWKVAHWCLKNLWQDLATPGVCCFVAQRLVAEFL